MPAPTPIYTSSNCRPAFQLNWSLTLFWKQPQRHMDWLDSLKNVTEPDGVRLLQHCFLEPGLSQFFLSTKPHVAPVRLVRSVKGRLQRLVSEEIPKGFRRHYRLQSIGSAKREVVEQYVAGLLEHHPLADPRTEETLQRLQIHDANVDLSTLRRTSHGQYCYNLHIVLVNEGRWRESRRGWLETAHDTILEIAKKRGHLLSRAAILPDHLHLVLGCPPDGSPEDVVLCYMNNLAYKLGRAPVFRFGYYVGTFGEYDRGVVGR